jgi:hypothetical protein
MVQSAREKLPSESVVAEVRRNSNNILSMVQLASHSLMQRGIKFKPFTPPRFGG